jgi:hypothetical protein
VDFEKKSPDFFQSSRGIANPLTKCPKVEDPTCEVDLASLLNKSGLSARAEFLNYAFPCDTSYGIVYVRKCPETRVSSV